MTSKVFIVCGDENWHYIYRGDPSDPDTWKILRAEHGFRAARRSVRQYLGPEPGVVVWVEGEDS